MLAVLVAACGDGDDNGDDTDAADDTGAEDADGDAEEAWEPTETVTMIVPFGAGGGTDSMGRAMASGLESVCPGLTISVENLPGGGGAEGYTQFNQRYEGDPHALVAVESSLIALPLQGILEFDYTAWPAVGGVSDHAGMLTATPGQFEDFDDFLEQAQESPVTVSLAGGELSFFSMMGASLEIAAGQNLFERVGFDTGSDATIAPVAGDTATGIASPEHAADFLRADDLEGLAVFTEERIDAYEVLADFPTVKEMGIDAAFTGIRGLMAAPGVSGPELQYWRDCFEDWLNDPSYDEYIESTVSIPRPTVGDEFIEQLERHQAEAEPAIERLQEVTG